MIAALVVNLVVSLIMLWLTHHMTTENALAFYPTTIPVMVQAGAGAALAGLGLLLPWRPARLVLLILSSVALGLLFAPALYALEGWPGGDDGGAFGWMFIVGGACFACFFIALLTLILGLIFGLRKKPPTEVVLAPAEPNAAIPMQGQQAGPAVESPRTNVGGKGLAAYWWLWVLLAVPVLYLFWCLAGPISWTTHRSRTLPGGIEVRTTDLHQLCPYPVPFYHYIDEDHELAFFVNGRELLKTDEYKHLFPSPGGTYVVAEHWLFTKPIKIYSVAADKWTVLNISDAEEDRDFPSHYYGYPLHFLRWDGDDGFLAEATGMDWNAKPSHRYRQVWRIDAASGARSLVSSGPKMPPATTQAVSP